MDLLHQRFNTIVPDLEKRPKLGWETVGDYSLKD
jgi:hypothetical protein